jgi:WD40 repeat protein
MIALNHTGTLLASASIDSQVRLWRLSDERNIAIFKHTNQALCATFSTDGKHILSGGRDKVISKWAVPLPEDILQDHASHILTINMSAYDACISGDLLTAVKLLTQDISADGNDYNSYANRSFVRARNSDWDCALDDALKSISIQPSLMGCISKGIAHSGKQQIQDAMKAFDLAFMYVDADLNKTRLLLLIKAIALFNANQHDEAILRVQELATTRPDPNSLACGIVEDYQSFDAGNSRSTAHLYHHQDRQHGPRLHPIVASHQGLVYSTLHSPRLRYPARS